METALYFPYMQVPQSAWFTQVLLYWDKVGVVVPDRREAISDCYTDELRGFGMLEYVSPQATVLSGGTAFEEAFLDLVDRRMPGSQRNSDFEHIHIDKLSRGLLVELEQRQLATPGEHGENWWRMESATAQLYMGYLASAMSGSRPGTLPITDQVDALARLGYGPTDSKSSIAQLRYIAIKRALPAPADPVPAHEIAEFKEANYEQLRTCREHLDGRLADLALIDDPVVRQIHMNRVLKEIEADVALLTEKMKRRGWRRVVLGTFCGMTAAAIPVAESVLSSDTVLGVGLAVAAGVFGVVPAAQQAHAERETRRSANCSPLAYAAVVGRTFNKPADRELGR